MGKSDTRTDSTAMEGRPAGMDLQVRLGLWSGWLMMVFIGAGFFLGDYIPPAGPAAPIEDIAALYQQEKGDLDRLGVILIMAGSALFLPFGAAIADRLHQIDGVRPVVIYVELIAACAAGTLILTFGWFVILGMLRPDMPMSSYQLLHDLTWIAIVGLWQPGALQAAATAVAILSDRSSTPLFPRWVGWFSVWMAIGSLTGSLIPFFREGPFAWDGSVAFFLAGVVFFGWFGVMLYCLHDIARRELRDKAQSRGVASLTGASGQAGDSNE